MSINNFIMMNTTSMILNENSSLCLIVILTGCTGNSEQAPGNLDSYELLIYKPFRGTTVRHAY